VLDGLRPARGEQHVSEPVWRDLDDHASRFGADVGCMAGRERAELVGLLLDSRDDARVLVTEVGEHQLRAEVQVAAAVRIDDVVDGGANECEHVARPLHRPRMKDQFVEIHGVLRQGRRPEDWMTVNVVPHVPGSANSPSASGVARRARPR
jgi:hypothetical protein